MQYAGIIKNDMASAPGINVTLFTQGCPHKCKNCHNPETWDFKGGRPFTDITLNEILDAIKANGIKRDFCIQGGEPLCPENRDVVLKIIWAIRHEFPEIKIYLWTGYIYEVLIEKNDSIITNILANIDVLIDGPYIDKLRDITLPMRGSSNQRIINLRGSK